MFSHITLVELTIDTEVKLRFLYKRTKRQAEQQGTTIEEALKWLNLEYEGDELTEKKFIKATMKINGGDWAGEFEPCPSCWKKVDVSGRDISHCNNVDKTLHLTRSSDWTYESICDAVLPCELYIVLVCTLPLHSPFGF